MADYARALRAGLGEAGLPFETAEAAPFRYAGQVMDAWYARLPADDLVRQVVDLIENPPGFDEEPPADLPLGLPEQRAISAPLLAA